MKHPPARSVPSTPRFPPETQLLSVSEFLVLHAAVAELTLIENQHHFAFFKPNNVTVGRTDALASVQQQPRDQLQLKLN